MYHPFHMVNKFVDCLCYCCECNGHNSLHRSKQSIQQRLPLRRHDARHDGARADVYARILCNAARRSETGQEHQSYAGQPRSLAQIPRSGHRDDHHQVRKVCPSISSLPWSSTESLLTTQWQKQKKTKKLKRKAKSTSKVHWKLNYVSTNFHNER